MADSVLWSGLPGDILSVIAKTLNSDVDIIRLRSVCSSWRSSVPGRYKPSSFPLVIPHIFSEFLPELGKSGHYFLECRNFYRVSPPEYGPYAGDPCDAWLFRVLEVNPNVFFSLKPLLHGRITHHLIPKSLNLLEHRISEICKCYSLHCVDVTTKEKLLVLAYIRKIIVLWNYAFDCEFIVLILFQKGHMLYWKFGDRVWTSVKTKGYCCSDVVLCAGKCYLISDQGVLIFIDSELNLNVAPLTPVPVNCNECTLYLVEYKSELYVVAKFYDEVKGNESDSTDDEDNATDEVHQNYGSDEEDIIGIPLELKIFKKGTNSNWECITCLEDKVFVIGQFVSFGFSAKDFRGCKGNCVYLSPTHYSYCPAKNKVDYGVYDLDERRTSVLMMDQGRRIICAPPPKWLMSSSSS